MTTTGSEGGGRLEGEQRGLNSVAEALRELCLADPVFTRRYEGWEEVGWGENSAVVCARRRSSGVPVALKVYWQGSCGGLDDPRGEVKALMRVTHPCVLRVYGTFEEHRPLGWIELERVEGITLQEALRRRSEGREGPWPLAQAIEIAACLAEGLAAVHAAGYTHGDVKPDNVLLPQGPGPAAKLCDLGLARELDATWRLDDLRAASPKYASPEAARGERTGREADVYALGLMLYEIVSGGLFPFELGAGATVLVALDCHRRRAPMPLRALGLGLPDELVDLIHGTLDKHPKRRPSAAEIACRLRALQAPAPVEGERGRWRRASVLALAAGAVLGVGGVLGLLWLLGLSAWR